MLPKRVKGLFAFHRLCSQLGARLERKNKLAKLGTVLHGLKCMLSRLEPLPDLAHHGLDFVHCHKVQHLLELLSRPLLIHMNGHTKS